MAIRIKSRQNERVGQMLRRFKKLCDVNWSGWKFGGHADPMCDDACDAAMMEDLMFPSPDVYQHQPMSPHISPHIHSHPHSASRPEMLPEVHFPPADSKTIAPPVHTHEKALDAELFQSLPDPFMDDEVRLQTENTVRPSNHVEVALRPVPRRPLSQSHERSSRRVKSVR